MRKFTRDDQRLMAIWALDCAERVLPLFEAAAAGDSRPRDAIAAGRAWVATGQFSMPVIRGVSLGAHAAAKEVAADVPACQAAHAAGQAVATAHVAQHAYGGAYYALRALAASAHPDVPALVRAELEWQTAELPPHLRLDISSHFSIREERSGVRIMLTKGPDF